MNLILRIKQHLKKKADDYYVDKTFFEDEDEKIRQMKK